MCCQSHQARRHNWACWDWSTKLAVKGIYCESFTLISLITQELLLCSVRILLSLWLINWPFWLFYWWIDWFNSSQVKVSLKATLNQIWIHQMFGTQFGNKFCSRGRDFNPLPQALPWSASSSSLTCSSPPLALFWPLYSSLDPAEFECVISNTRSLVYKGHIYNKDQHMFFVL